MKDSVHDGKVHVLMLGYNGANNTGAEALLVSDIEDVRSVLGSRAQITVPTLNEANLRRYLSEDESLRIAPIPTVYFAAIRRLVRENDVVMLIEGSTYMDTWGSPLLWAFLWATHCAAELGKPSIAYAVDAGKLSAANTRRVRSVASRTGLIVTRNARAAERLRSVGVSAPIEWTADNAFTFIPADDAVEWVSRDWPEAKDGAVGIALEDISLWPVVPRLFGRRADCYKWPFYFSRSPERRRVTEQLATGYAELADEIVSREGYPVALICMEQVDEALAGEVMRRVKHPERVRIYSAREHDASRMTALLRSLRLLVTTRFHASVLSLAASVPQIAVGHDLRLRTIFDDMRLSGEWFVDPWAPQGHGVALDPELFGRLRRLVRRLLSQPELQAEALDRGYVEHLARARRNRRLLRRFLERELGLERPEATRRSRVLAGGVR